MDFTSRQFLTLALLASSLTCPNGWARDKRGDISKIGKRNIARKSIISWEKEREVGHEYAVEVEARTKLVTDSRITQYVDGLAQIIAQNSDLKIPLVVEVIDSPEPNGLILPGGFIYINSGLIRMTENEGELAGLLSFGIADIATRHWASGMSKATILQYAMVPLIFTPATYGQYYGVMQAYMNGVPLTFLKFSREDVVESDYFALQYLYKAGYDPESYITLLDKFAKVEDSQANKPPESLRDRPPARIRIANCQKEISSILPPRDPSHPDNSDFAKTKALLETASKPSGTP